MPSVSLRGLDTLGADNENFGAGYDKFKLNVRFHSSVAEKPNSNEEASSLQSRENSLKTPPIEKQNVI
jgi:hypothetical protein